MPINLNDYDDYPMGDEKSYQNRKKYGMEVHPNSSAAKHAKIRNGLSKNKALDRMKEVRHRIKKAGSYLK